MDEKEHERRTTGDDEPMHEEGEARKRSLDFGARVAFSSACAAPTHRLASVRPSIHPAIHPIHPHSFKRSSLEVLAAI